MIINRDDYIKKLVAKRWNGKVKIITGIRRCGKSFLLSTLYKEYLKAEGVADDSFVEIALDKRAHLKYRNPNIRIRPQSHSGYNEALLCVHR